MGGKRVLRNYDSNGNLISKECSKCHEVKAVSEFSKNKSRKDGVDAMCKDCRKEYYKQNAEHYAEYYKQNTDKIKERNAEYYKQNAEYHAEYRKQNADKIKEYQSEYRKQNAEYYAEYRKQNADKIKERNAEYYAEYYKQKVEQSLIEIKAYVEKNPQRYNYNPNKEIYGIIYLVHNVKSDKYYVGQTTIGFDNRYQSGWLYEHSYKDTVKEDLELYGESSFEYVKIFRVAHNQQDLDKLEAYYIDYFNAYDNGYNENRGNIFTERK